MPVHKKIDNLSFTISGAYTQLQFLRAVSYSVGGHSSRLCDDDDDNLDVDDDDANVAQANTDTDSCEVCLIVPHNPWIMRVGINACVQHVPTTCLTGDVVVLSAKRTSTSY